MSAEEGHTDPNVAAEEWMRRAAQAFGDAATVEAIREHVRDGEPRCVEWCPLCRGAELLRATATPERREQWSSLQREALLTIRSLVDHYLSRLDSEPNQRGARVRDIPIE